MVSRLRFTRSRQPDRLLNKREVAAMLGVDWTTLDRWRRAGTFPPGITLTDATLRWRLADVEAWLLEKEEANG